MQFFQGIPQIIIIIGFYRVKPAIYHRRRLAVSRQWFCSRTVRQRDRITDAAIADIFHARRQIADTAAFKGRDGVHLGNKDACFCHFKFHPAGHHADPVPCFETTFHDADIGNGSFVRIKM